MEILGWKDNSSPRLRFLTKVDRLTAGTILYTAPPPQQAASEGVQLQRWGRGPEPHPYLLQRLEDGYWTPWHIAQAAVNAATQPQQAGGDALVDRIAYALAAHEVWGGQLTPDEALKDEKMREECYARAELVAEMLSTSPQPEAGGGEAMRELAEKADAAYRAFKGAFDTPAAWRRDGSDYADDARERLRAFFAEFAAITTPASGGEHGR